MLHMMFDKKYWFRSKKYGLGSYPHTWQGWAFVGLYLAFMLGMGMYAARYGGEVTILWWAVIIIVTALFTFSTWKKTEGGWRWRWGK
ncbi:hypothetical protein [Sphingorhabdus sp. Alg239-R122]|uniref:hypothetical protein n=1 Tax=Sphingorhabdus sp. Alg239-R122 TaxID=2305989 RepID=UPI0013DC2434|nr:hypothetical protein [Sphingorhabdus sp. Alg239-R122]